MFGLDRGFDVVTGNPPYVRQEKIKHLKPLLKRNYENTYTGTADLYVYFYERALQLLRDGGILSYISSNSFLNSGFGAKLRRHLATTTSIQVLIDFAEANVFTAITEPCIVIAKKEQVESNSFKALRWDEEKPLVNVRDEFAAHAFAIPQNTLSASPWQIEVSTVRNLIGHISEGRPSLRTIVNDRNFYGVKTGLNDAFLIDGSTREHLIHEDPRSADLIRPYLRGRDMRPWTPFFADQWMIFTRHGTDIDAYPAIKKHLLPFKAKLQPKPKNWPHDKAWKGRKPGSYKWYEIQDNVAYFDEFSKPKIIYQEINRTDAFAHDDRGLFLNNKLFMLPEAPLWLLGILNSRVAAFYLHGSTGVPRGGFLALQWPVLAPLPVAVPDGSQARVLVALVQLRICLNDLVSEADRNTRDPLMLAYCEQILNGLVYELYFPEEVRSAGLRLFELVEQAALPALDAIPEGERLAHLRRLFEILHGGAHPLKIALQKLQTLDTVRVIEGKA
jgi:adenine-specific DNA-methyltransferase